MSDDGRFIVFASSAPNLVAGQIDTNNVEDVFLYDGGSASAFWIPPVAIISPSPVLVNRGRVYVGGDLSRLYSIDATSMTPPAPSSIVLGDPLVPKVVGAPVLDVLNGLMIAGSDLGVIFAVLVPF